MISLRSNVFIAAACLATICGLAGCGGSGSSGFDSAPTSEPDAIRQATQDGACVEYNGTIYCASGVPVVIEDDSAAVQFDEPSEPLPCPALPGDGGCTTSVGFSPDGFPPGTTFLGAWAESENGPWTLSDTEATSGDPGTDDRDVNVLLPDAGGAPPSAVVVAVLVYPGPFPTDLPAVSLRLRGFAPDFVYVTSDFAVDAGAEPGEPPIRP